jgi:hypothetical protein
MRDNLRFSLPILAGLMSVGVALGARAAEPDVYEGMCNASAAIAIGPKTFVVADDELNILRIYEVGKPAGTPVPFDKFLQTKPDKESDIEGAALLGGRIYWITSHGTNKDAEIQPRRYRFFTTTRTAPIKPVGTAPNVAFIEDLKGDALKAFDLAKASTIAPKAPGGLNIEGLAALGTDKLLIGFRNPLPGGKTLIVPVENPDAVGKGKAAVFGTPILLDLGGRGVRSLERVGDRYLIVAGPIDDGHDFRIYAWAGPQTTTVTELPKAVLRDLHVEALFALGQDVYVLSDDGKRDGIECDARPVKSFRGLRIKPAELVGAR